MAAFMTATRLSAALMAWMLSACPGAIAQMAPPDTENGRYSLSPIAGGVLRLDSRNGAVATCAETSTGWACHAAPDERSALDAEIGRLQAENERLRAQLSGGNKTDEALPKSDPLMPSAPRAADGSRKLEIPLPSDADVDRAVGFLERVWRRLMDMAGRIQRDSSGKI